MHHSYGKVFMVTKELSQLRLVKLVMLLPQKRSDLQDADGSIGEREDYRQRTDSILTA